MVQTAGEKVNFGRGTGWLFILLPLALAACQSTPEELANNLAEPAVVTASAHPAGTQVAEVSPELQPTSQSAAGPRDLASIVPQHSEPAVEVQELKAPKPVEDAPAVSPTAPQLHAVPVPEKSAAAPKTESAALDKAATAPKADLAAPVKTAGAFEWPVEGKIIETFGANPDGQRNDGINIAADTGTPIHAAANGTVTYASNLKGYGNLVLIRHRNGYITAYAHAEKLLVSAGDQVDRGDVIGYAGKSGGVGTPQLHFEIRKGTRPVDPRPLMMAGRVS